MEISWFRKGETGYEKGYKAALFVRDEVFTKEQGFRGDIDEIDEIAHHLLVLDDDGQPVGTARIYAEDGGKTMHVGRVATLAAHRGRHVGKLLLCEAEKKAAELGAHRMELSAQKPAEGFYLRQGYRTVSGIYYDQFCRHVDMEKEL